MVTGSVLAQPFRAGDVAIDGQRLIDSHGVIVLHDAQGTLDRTLVDTSAQFADIGFGANGLLYAAGASVVAYAPSGTPAYVFPAESCCGGPSLQDLTFAGDGRVLALWSGNRVVTYTANGTRVGHVDIVGPFSSSGVQAIDLSSDQCRLYFTIGPLPVTFGGAVGRIDLCTAGAVPEYLHTYSSLPQADIRILPSGEILIARFADGVDLLSATGDLIRSFPVPANALAIAPDRQSFYVSWGTDPVRRIDLATGAVVTSFPTGVGVSSLAVVGDPRAALASPASDIPVGSGWLVGVLAISLALAAVTMIRR